MKKLLGIVVLGLLCCTTSIAVVTNQDIGSSAKKVCGKLYFCYKGLITAVYIPEFKSEVWYSSEDRDKYYLFNDVAKPSKFYKINFRHKFYGLNNNKYGGSLVSFYDTFDDAKSAANPKLFKKLETEKVIAKDKIKNKDTNDKISQSKRICKELGFKANSEKFADCALKMMALQFDTGNKVSNNDGSSTQQIIVKQQDDFDIGDFFFGLQKIVDDNYRSTNNNSSNQGTNCRIVPKAWGADMVCR